MQSPGHIPHRIDTTDQAALDDRTHREQAWRRQTELEARYAARSAILNSPNTPTPADQSALDDRIQRAAQGGQSAHAAPDTRTPPPSAFPELNPVDTREPVFHSQGAPLPSRRVASPMAENAYRLAEKAWQAVCAALDTRSAANNVVGEACRALSKTHTAESGGGYRQPIAELNTLLVAVDTAVYEAAVVSADAARMAEAMLSGDEGLRAGILRARIQASLSLMPR